MTMKIRPAFIVLFLAVGLAAIFYRLPGVIRYAVITYANHLSPTKMILIGDSVACEELKSQISSMNTQEKEKSYQELLRILKLPVNEFRHLVDGRSSLRKLLAFINQPSILSRSQSSFTTECG